MSSPHRISTEVLSIGVENKNGTCSWSVMMLQCCIGAFFSPEHTAFDSGCVARCVGSNIAADAHLSINEFGMKCNISASSSDIPFMMDGLFANA